MYCGKEIYKRADQKMLNVIMNIIYISIVSMNPIIVLSTLNLIIMNRKQGLFLTVAISVCNFILLISNKNYLAIPILTFIIIVYLYSVLKKLLFSIFVSILIQIIIAFSDICIGLIVMHIFKLSYYQIVQDKTVYFMVNCIILLISYIIAKFIRSILKKLESFDLGRYNIRNMAVLTLYISLIFVYMYIYLFAFKYEFHKNVKNEIILELIFIVVNIASMVIIINLNKINIRKNLEEKYRKKELYCLKQYTSTMEDLMSDLKKFRHDYINISVLLNGYIETENIKEIKKFYKTQVLPEHEKFINKNLTISLLNHIKIEPVKNFIIYKISTEKTKNIEIKIEINEDINKIAMREIDLCRILGIFIDNAIEATDLCENKFIIIWVIKNDDSVTFIINNSCSENTPSVHEIYQEKFSTKGVERGLGLCNVREIISQNYNNVLLSTNVLKCIFKQELIIFFN